MPVVKDRRRSPRVELEGRARIDTDRDRFEGHVVDLGLHGVAIRSTRAARPEALVTVELLVGGQRVRVDATVARRQRAGGEYLLGLAFVGLDLDAQRCIEHWVFERLAGSPLADVMRAFVAHADRVPPRPAPAITADRTVVVGALPVPVISGHTQVVAVGRLPVVDHTVIAPAPPRSETVLADAPPVPASKRSDTVRVSAPTAARAALPGVPDDAWLDDEMDTAQFRLLEAAQAREAAEREGIEVEIDEVDEVEEEIEDDEIEDGEVELLEPEDPVPDHTVVVGGFTVPLPRERTLVTVDATEPLPRERTLVTDGDAERPPRERPLVTADATVPLTRERTLVTVDATEPLPRERTLVTVDATEPLPRERTLVTDGATVPLPRERTLVTDGAAERSPRERTLVTADAPTEPLREPLAERTLPFLRDFLGPLGSRSGTPERTEVGVVVPAADAPELSPSARALLDAAALLRPPDATTAAPGPRVVVSVPHRTYRRVAPTPWNLR